MTYRFHGSDGASNPTEEWSRRRVAAQRVEKAAQAIRVRAGSDTVVGVNQLIDALDHYWQVRYGGRVVIVKPEEPER